MKKKCNRKVRPLINPIAYALSGAAMIPDADLVGLRTRELAAIEAFRTGGAGLQEWADVNSMLTMCEVMARNGVGSEALPTCEAAQDALKAAAIRYEQTKRMGTNGPGLQAFRDLYEYHDLQRTSVHRSEYEKYLRLGTNHLKSKSRHVEEIV